MGQGNRQALLEQALTVSRQMAEMGAAGEWAQVVELERRRSGLLEQAFTDPSPADEPTALQIRAILELDKRLMGMGIEARAEAASELAQLQRGRKGQQAYHQAAGR